MILSAEVMRTNEVKCMKNERRFRTVNVPLQIFNNCAICAGHIGMTVTKKEILKNEQDDFEGIIEGTGTRSGVKTIIRMTIRGWRDYDWHAGFWPSAQTTDLTIETFEVKNNEELPDTPVAIALNEEFNNHLSTHYVWHTSG
jgi:hypothetical protein